MTEAKAARDLRRGDVVFYEPGDGERHMGRVLQTRPGCISELMPEELMPWATRRAVVVVEFFLIRPLMIPDLKWPTNYWRAWLRPDERLELCNRRSSR